MGIEDREAPQRHEECGMPVGRERRSYQESDNVGGWVRGKVRESGEAVALAGEATLIQSSALTSTTLPLPTAPNPRSTRQLPHMSLHIHFHPSTLPP